MTFKEAFSLIEQNKQEAGSMLVQTQEKQAEKPQKKRSIEDKVGRQKWHQVLTKKVYLQNERILDELRWIRHRLKALGESDIDMPMLERYAFEDQVDLEIFQRVMTTGDIGVFPKDVAADPALARFQLRYFHVSRRIVRMNKRLHFETGECLFEKRGHKWAVTAFGFDVWGKSKKEFEDDKNG
jgi:hypothetical protein